MRRKRLLWHLYPSYLLITLAALFAVAWYSSRTLRQSYHVQAASDLEAMARLVRSRLLSSTSPGDRTEIDRLCHELGRDSGSRVTVILPTGEVIGDSHEDASRMENHGDRPEVLEALAGRVGKSDRFSTTLQRDMMYVALPARGGGRRIIVRTALPVTAVDAALAGFYRRIAAAGLVVALLAALVSLLAARRITRPLEELRLGAERFAAGELHVRLASPDSTELASLARAMNHMAEQLDNRIAREARQSNEQEAVLSSMVESVLAVDEGERMLRVNNAAAGLFGIEKESVEGRPLQEVVRNPGLHELVKRVLASEETVEGDLVLHEPDERSLQVHGNPLRDSTGRSIGALLVLNDITQLRRLERVRRDFVANVSHELRTPITTIKGFVETLADGAIEQRQDATRFLDIIAEHTERLNAIIEDLLALSRLELDAEEGVVQLERQNIHAVVARAVNMCRPQAGTRGVHVNLAGDSAIQCALSAPLLERAVVNLIDNATKYSDEGGEVRIKIDETPEGAGIHVTDRGCGIAARHLPRIFERFYRTDPARSRGMGGTGLGLAIVKHIALVHGGRVSVDSTPGRGSTFSILLPARPRS
ncbi:MAG: ATP-binding protein [Candidatus Krumholzibacteriia bacterium]